MRTREQITKMVAAFMAGETKTQCLIAGGYSPRSASANACKVLPRENQRHARFAAGLFLFDWNKAAAARYAGYKPKWAHTNTSRLMSHPEVKREIERIREELQFRLWLSRQHFTPEEKPMAFD